MNLVLSQVRILAPPALVDILRKKFKSESLPAATATFGAPFYGDSFMGALVYSASIGMGCSTDSEADYKTIISELPREFSKILLLHRGDCSFVKKAQVGEALGAQAIIIVDNSEIAGSQDEISRTILGDDGSGSLVRIPSVMISHAAASEILKEFQISKLILVQLIWTIPQKSVVEVDFWSESGTIEAQRFLQAYAAHAMQFGGNLRFIPHYFVYSLPKATPISSNLCWGTETELCSNPSSLTSSTVTGNEVLQEDVRQLCLFKVTAQKVDNLENSFYSKAWWSYVQKSPTVCFMNHSEKSQLFGLECSVALMKTILPASTLTLVQNCWENNGTSLLEQEKRNRAWSPLALRINGARFNGSLDPILVSRAVCSAYEKAPKCCSSIEKISSRPISQDSNTVKPYTQFWFYLIVFFGIVAAGVCVYQSYLRKSMRNALRQEIMLEVRSQLQDYHSLDDDYSAKNQKNKFLPL